MLLNRKCKIDVYQVNFSKSVLFLVIIKVKILFFIFILQERGSQFGRGGDRGGRGMGRDAARDDPFYGRSEKSDDWRR